MAYFELEVAGIMTTVWTSPVGSSFCAGECVVLGKLNVSDRKSEMIWPVALGTL